jgi:hypothetical protein
MNFGKRRLLMERGLLCKLARQSRRGELWQRRKVIRARSHARRMNLGVAPVKGGNGRVAGKATKRWEMLSLRDPCGLNLLFSATKRQNLGSDLQPKKGET